MLRRMFGSRFQRPCQRGNSRIDSLIYPARDTWHNDCLLDLSMEFDGCVCARASHLHHLAFRGLKTPCPNLLPTQGVCLDHSGGSLCHVCLRSIVRYNAVSSANSCSEKLTPFGRLLNTNKYAIHLRACRGGSRISGKGAHMYKGVCVVGRGRFAFLKYPMEMK